MRTTRSSRPRGQGPEPTGKEIEIATTLRRRLRLPADAGSPVRHAGRDAHARREPNAPRGQHGVDAPRGRSVEPGVVGAVAITTVAAAYAIAMIAGVGSGPGIATAVDLLPPVVGLGAATLAWRASDRWTGAVRITHAWRFLAFAMVASAAGDLLWWSARTTDTVSTPIDILAAAAFLAFFPLAAAGLARLTETPTGTTERLRYLLDAGSIFVAALIAIYFVVRPWDMAAESTVQRLVAYVTPAGDALVIVALGLTALRWPGGLRRGPFAVLGLGFAVLLAGDLALAYAAARGFTLALAEVAYPVGAAMVGCAAAMQVGARRGAAWESGPDDRIRALVGLLPPAVVAVAFAAILLTETDHVSASTLALVVGGVTITGLAALRQVVVHRDAAETRRDRQQAAAGARFRTVVESATDVIVTVAPSGRITTATPSLERLTGWTPSESTGISFLDRVHSDDRSRVARLVVGEPRHGRSSSSVFEFRMLRRDGEWVDVEAAVVDLRDDATVGGTVLTIRDIGDRKVFESDLRRQAFQDQLTGLPNRAHFIDRIEQALGRSTRTGQPIQVLYLDLDGFKRINDSLGHDAGDRVLRVVAERLTWAVRAGDTAARLGGDEFAVLLEDHATAEAARAVAERIQAMIAPPIDVEGRHVRVGVSVGIASPATASSGMMEPEDHRTDRAATADELIRNADVAMYESKVRGKGRVSTYEPAMRLAAVTRLDLETALREAVEREEFAVHFQPIVSLDSGRIVAIEALARWARPGVGLVPPSGFIAVAEETGLIRPIGMQVFRSACEAAVLWGGGTVPVDLTVNLSARQLQDPHIVETIRRVLTQSGLDPHKLVLEITESALIEDGLAAIDQLVRMRELGIRLAIDDFGTGYSSLGYLERLPVDILKIDRAFVVDLPTSPKRSALVRAIVGMAGALRLTTIAEGVETEEQLRIVGDIGCDLAQGYLLSRPVEAAEIAVLIERDVTEGGAFRDLVLPAASSAEWIAGERGRRAG
jgi:diguanylate cyclase (GGDEF)-like protein/PAS domain S-box-containing protein